MDIQSRELTQKEILISNLLQILKKEIKESYYKA